MQAPRPPRGVGLLFLQEGLVEPLLPEQAAAVGILRLVTEQVLVEVGLDGATEEQVNPGSGVRAARQARPPEEDQGHHPDAAPS